MFHKFLYQHKVASIPKMLYLAIPIMELETILNKGIEASEDDSIILHSDIKYAYKSSYDASIQMIVLSVEASQMYSDGIHIQHYKNNLWLTNSIPARYVKRIPFIEICFDRFHKTFREYYIEDSSEKVMFRFAVHSRKILRKFYGETKEHVVSTNNSILINAIKNGFEITQNEYKKGKKLSLKKIVRM